MTALQTVQFVLHELLYDWLAMVKLALNWELDFQSQEQLKTNKFNYFYFKIGEWFFLMLIFFTIA
jgi:hypothetical protein